MYDDKIVRGDKEDRNSSLRGRNEKQVPLEGADQLQIYLSSDFLTLVASSGNRARAGSFIVDIVGFTLSVLLPAHEKDHHGRSVVPWLSRGVERLDENSASNLIALPVCLIR